MLNCLHSPASVSGISADIALPERRRLRFRWQLKQQLHDPGPYGEAQRSFLAPTAQAPEFPGSVASEVSELGEVVSGTGMTLGGWPETARVPAVESGDGNGMGCAICRTAGCPPAAPTAEWGHGGRGDSVSASGVATESFGKRKVEKLLHHKVGGGEFEGRAKRTKGCPSGGESKTTEESRNNAEASPETSKEDSKFSVVQQKPDYIHVRARRGQATDSHSLAERVRREKISERMNHLQDLVPGCSKTTGKAAMLDEIINYIQSLQKQVEVLSMKLAAVNDTLFVEEVIPAGPASFPMADPAFPQYNPLQQAAASGFELGVCPPELGFEGAVMPIPQPLVDVSSFSQIQTTSTWEAGLQSLCGEDPQGRYPFHMGCVEADNVEMFGEAGNLKMDI